MKIFSIELLLFLPDERIIDSVLSKKNNFENVDVLF